MALNDDDLFDPAPAKSKPSSKIVFQPPTANWSLSRLPEVQTYYQKTYGSQLPLTNRGQGSIHNRWGYDHRNSADISLDPRTKEGQGLMEYFKQNNIPFLAFTQAIPGVATGPHIHAGYPSKKTTQKFGIGAQLKKPAVPSEDLFDSEQQPAKAVSDDDLFDAAPQVSRETLKTPQVTSTVKEIDEPTPLTRPRIAHDVPNAPGEPIKSPSLGMGISVPLSQDDTPETLYQKAYTRAALALGFDAENADRIANQLAKRTLEKNQGHIFHAGTNQPMSEEELAQLKSQPSTAFSFDDPELIQTLTDEVNKNKPLAEKLVEMSQQNKLIPEDARFATGLLAKAGAGLGDIAAGGLRIGITPNLIGQLLGYRDPLQSVEKKIGEQSAGARKAATGQFSTPVEAAQNIGAGLLEGAPIMLATAGTGAIPTALAFGTQSALQSAGQQKSLSEVALQAGKGAATGALLGAEGAEIPSIIKAGGAGLGSFGIEKATGASNPEALASAAQTAGLRGLGELHRLGQEPSTELNIERQPVAGVPGEATANIDQRIAARESKVQPTFLRDDSGKPVARVLNPEEVADGAKPKIRPIHQSDTQIRDAQGKFAEPESVAVRSIDDLKTESTPLPPVESPVTPPEAAQPERTATPPAEGVSVPEGKQKLTAEEVSTLPEGFKRAQPTKPEGVQWLLYRDKSGSVVGRGALEGDQIVGLEVLPEARRQGNGSAILDDLIQRGGREAVAGSAEARDLYRQRGQETKSNRFTFSPQPEPKPTATVPRETTASVSETPPETKQSRLGRGVEAKAVEAKLAQSFEGLPEYETVKVKDQAERASALLESDPVKAKRVALGQEAAPADVLPESVFIAVENQALKNRDVDTLRELATASTLPKEASGMGQRIRMLAERNPNSAVTAMRDVQLAREARVAKKFGTIEKAKNQIKSEIQIEMKRSLPKARDWSAFLDEISCK